LTIGQTSAPVHTYTTPTAWAFALSIEDGPDSGAEGLRVRLVFTLLFPK